MREIQREDQNQAKLPELEIPRPEDIAREERRIPEYNKEDRYQHWTRIIGKGFVQAKENGCLKPNGFRLAVSNQVQEIHLADEENVIQEILSPRGWRGHLELIEEASGKIGYGRGDMVYETWYLSITPRPKS